MSDDATSLLDMESYQAADLLVKLDEEGARRLVDGWSKDMKMFEQEKRDIRAEIDREKRIQEEAERVVKQRAEAEREKEKTKKFQRELLLNTDLCDADVSIGERHVADMIRELSDDERDDLIMRWKMDMFETKNILHKMKKQRTKGK